MKRKPDDILESREAACFPGLKPGYPPAAVMVRLLLASWLALPLGVQSAPLPPDAGQILESVPAVPTPPAVARPLLPRPEDAARPALSGTDAVRIPLRGVRITGATLYPATTLEALLRDLIGSELTLPELDAAAQRITRYYRDHDVMLARAYLPAQDISDGIVEIAVLEGRYGEVMVRNQSGLKTFAEGALTKPLTPAAAIIGRAVERVTLLADDLHGVDAASTLRPGKQVGTSDFVLELREGKPRDASIEFDNAGSRYTGRYRVGGSLAINNPTGLGDRLQARLLSSGNGLLYGQLGYQLPLGYTGSTLALSATQADYQLGEDFASLDASGTARVAGLSLNHAWVRSERYNLRGRLAFDYKKLRDRIAATSTDKHSGAVSLGLLGDLEGESGKSHYSALLYAGKLDAAITPAGTRGAFNKLVLSAQHQRYLGAGYAFSLAYSGQFASKNLDSSEKMSMGGPNGVRAYPQAEASGDDAHLVNLELRRTLEPLSHGSVDLLLLADFGASRLVHGTWPGYTGASERRLSSIGVGVAFRARSNWSVRADYARRLGSGPAQSEPDSSGRFWLQVTKLY